MNNPIKPKSLEGLESRIGHTFRNKEYITVALTHSSYSNEMKSKGQKTPFNERLEFLGDSVLSIVVSSYIFDKYKNKQEGDLTKIRAAVVCEKALAKYANDISLGDYMYLGHGEIMNNGRKRPSILADAVEAVIAAMYLDGGLAPAKQFIETYILRDLPEGTESPRMDYKTTLQELVQRQSGQVLAYQMIGESGPEHNKLFTAEVVLNGNVIGTGDGHTKKAAEQAAAKCALEVLQK